MKKKLTDLSAKAYLHSADLAALSALRSLPGLDKLTAGLINLTSGKSLRLLFLGSAVRTSDAQFPRVHSLLKETAFVLDMPVPECFVTRSPEFNAGTYGVDAPFIMLNSALVNELDDAELASVIGHELAHIQCGHVLYKTLLWLLMNISLAAAGLPAGWAAQVALTAVLAALKEWDRKSELSADRGGFLAVQDRDAAFRLLMKMAGGNDTGQMNINEFFLQAEEYEKGGDLLDSAYKMLNLSAVTHPFPVLRLKELKVWLDSGASDRILSGEYRHGSTDTNEPIKDFYRAAEDAYKEYQNSPDPLAASLRDFGKQVEKAAAAAGKEVDSFLQGIFASGQDNKQ